ncbi:Os01g0102850, partial [Oryza sativa Japonica Group]
PSLDTVVCPGGSFDNIDRYLDWQVPSTTERPAQIRADL